MEKFNSLAKRLEKKISNLQAIKFLFRRMKFQTKVVEREGDRLPLVSPMSALGNQLAAY